MISKTLTAVFTRDIRLAIQQRAELAQPLMFFVIVVSLFPLAIGQSPEMLQRVSGGVVWVAAILALLLSMERIFRDDYIDGTLEQYMLSATPLYAIVLMKIFAHWLANILPLLIISPLVALFLNMTIEMYGVLVLTLIIGTPIISLIGAIGVALTLSLQRSGVLLSLLLLPLFIPLLIFATSAVDSVSLQLPYMSQIGIIAGMFFVVLALAPMAISYSLKVSQH